MADDGKRTEVVSLKITERMALDLLRDSSEEERSISDLIYRMVRKELYGTNGRRETANAQITKGDKVNRGVDE